MKKKLELTDNPMTNIQIMAPLLNERQQVMVFGMIVGMIPDKVGLKEGRRDGTKERQEV